MHPAGKNGSKILWECRPHDFGLQAQSGAQSGAPWLLGRHVDGRIWQFGINHANWIAGWVQT
jgi:hypothetical protein